MGGWSGTMVLAAQAVILDESEREQVEAWLRLTNWMTFALVVGLLIFATTLRRIALKRTHPCEHCREFISNKSAKCPRCGRTESTRVSA